MNNERVVGFSLELPIKIDISHITELSMYQFKNGINDHKKKEVNFIDKTWKSFSRKRIYRYWSSNLQLTSNIK